MARFIFTLFFLFFAPFASQGHQVQYIALTIDDLPFVGEAKNFHLNMIIETLRKYNIPVTGFVIAGNVGSDNWPLLKKFKDSGFGLGNHTLSHVSAQNLSAEEYIQQIAKADQILKPMLTNPKFFRYPYLSMGDGAKKEKIQAYLNANDYHIAPITIDSKDFIFNQLLLSVPEKERRNFMLSLKPCYIDYIWQQTLKSKYTHPRNQISILLIHANLINAYTLSDIIELYQQRGYRFISLLSALNTAN